MKITKEGVITEADLIQMIESTLPEGEKIRKLKFDMKCTGDYDRGDYKETLKTITFEIYAAGEKL